MKYVMKDNQVFGYDAHQSDLYNNALAEGAVAISHHEVDALLNPPLTAQQKLDEQQELRALAYREESDPLFIEWQYDRTDKKRPFGVTKSNR